MPLAASNITFRQWVIICDIRLIDGEAAGIDECTNNGERIALGVNVLRLIKTF